MEPPERQIELLLVDDNPGDARLLAECLRTVTYPYHLNILTDGEAALAFLKQQTPYTAAPTPDLILLDIHPRKRSGWEVLEWLRTTPALARIPVVMWGGTVAPFDEQERDRLQPASCLVKPTSLEGYQRIAELIEKLITQKTSDSCA
ncbi:MAG TPA: response regulator [Candidatus Binatia bacterium]|jgi:CheY-like chemotaxis protein|nr:response regulator [Candidatus Binatia bacterium]